MHGFVGILSIVLALFFLLPLCGSSIRPLVIGEEYFNKLVSKNATGISDLSCSAWAKYASTEMNLFQVVTAGLLDLSCKVIGTEGEVTLKVWRGNIAKPCNDGQQQFEVSDRTNKTMEPGGECLVRGYR